MNLLWNWLVSLTVDVCFKEQMIQFSSKKNICAISTARFHNSFCMHNIFKTFMLRVWYNFNVDIDECSTLPASCSQECNNMIGSFVCYCTDGYYLGDDMGTCNGKAFNLCMYVCTIRIYKLTKGDSWCELCVAKKSKNAWNMHK